MVLKYDLQNRNLILTNPEELTRSDDVSFIQCRVDLHSSVFRAEDVLVAVFKSASYNIKEEVILSVSYDTVDGEIVDIRGYAFVPTKVFEHGGVIQLMIYKKGRVLSDLAQVSTNTVEFFLDPRRYVPLTVPQMWQYIAHEVSDIWEIIGSLSDLDYEVLINKPSIEGITLIGNKTYPELNLLSLTNTEIDIIVAS